MKKITHIYYPLVSGVANSFFPYALKKQDPEEGFARLAFGHGYATVLDDFPVISMATIRNPIPFELLGKGQMYFYTNLMSNNIIYGYIAPTQDKIDPWFFSSPSNDEALYVLTFPKPATIYADSFNKLCSVILED